MIFIDIKLWYFWTSELSDWSVLVLLFINFNRTIHTYSLLTANFWWKMSRHFDTACYRNIELRKLYLLDIKEQMNQIIQFQIVYLRVVVVTCLKIVAKVKIWEVLFDSYTSKHSSLFTRCYSERCWDPRFKKY